MKLCLVLAALILSATVLALPIYKGIAYGQQQHNANLNLVKTEVLNKRTPVTFYNFLDDGARGLEAAGNTAARGASSPDSDFNGELVSTHLTLGQPNRATQQAVSATLPPLQTSVDTPPTRLSQHVPATDVTFFKKRAQAQVTRPTALHAIPNAEREDDADYLSGKAKVGSAFGAFNPFRPFNGPLKPSSATLTELRKQLTAEARPVMASDVVRESARDISHRPSEQGARDAFVGVSSQQQSRANSSTRKFTRTPEEKLRKNLLAWRRRRELKEAAASGDKKAQAKVVKNREKNVIAWHTMTKEQRELKNATRRDQYGKQKALRAPSTGAEYVHKVQAIASRYERYQQTKDGAQHGQS